MGFYLFLLFTVVPLLELALLVWVGGQTAWWVPILLVLVDAALGAALIRWQGVRVVRRIQEDLAAGRMPGDALIDGALFLVAAALLIAPGILTDIVGFALSDPAASSTGQARCQHLATPPRSGASSPVQFDLSDRRSGPRRNYRSPRRQHPRRRCALKMCGGLLAANPAGVRQSLTYGTQFSILVIKTRTGEL